MNVQGLMLVVLLASGAWGQTTPSTETIDRVAWLQGCWTTEAAANGASRAGVVDEQWMAPRGGTMLGMSRTVAGGRTVAHEFVVLREDANGDIVYEAHPSGQAAASFKLVRWSTTEAVFENLAHDFPQRVIYALAGEQGLNAAIEGTRNGKIRRVEFPYRRVSPE